MGFEKEENREFKIYGSNVDVNVTSKYTFTLLSLSQLSHLVHIAQSNDFCMTLKKCLLFVSRTNVWQD